MTRAEAIAILGPEDAAQAIALGLQLPRMPGWSQ